jgi:hypothetical protein
MTNTFTPCMAILPVAQRELWPELIPLVDLGFVLYGGTAIALRLGHRESVDFDFFTDWPLDRNALQRALPFLERSQVLQDQPDTLSMLVPCSDVQHEHVKLSFFGAIGFGRVGEPEFTDDGVLLAASLDDLMATKLKVVLQRVEAKDYRDVAAMTASGIRLDKGLSSARQLFGPAFQPSESLKALVYFEGGDLNSLTREEKRTLVKSVASVRDLPDSPVVSSSLSPIRQPAKPKT